jgi:tetratricopeptide (TPR) repeat protein/DNA-binding CsgD family transcriptional regulator
MKLLTTILLCSICGCLTFAQVPEWQTDSIRVDSIYNVAVEFSNKEPQRANDELQKLIDLIDNKLLEAYPNQDYLLERKATSKHFLAYYKRRESSFDEALKLYLESIDIKKQINDTLSIPTTLNQLGFLWLYQEQYSKAEDYFSQALNLSEKYKTIPETISILSNLGTTYLFKKQKDKAQESHRRAIFLADSINNKRLIASTAANYAILLRKLKQYRENIPYVVKSIEFNQELNNKIGLESGWFALGVTYRKLNQPQKAISYFEKAIDLSLELNSTALLPTRYYGISNAYDDAGNSKLALEYFKKYEKALRSRNDQAEIKKMADLEASYKYNQQRVVDSLKLEQEKLLQKQDLEAHSKQKIAVIVTIALLLVLLALIGYLFLRQKKLLAEKSVLEKIKENYELSQEVENKEYQVKDLLSENVKHIKNTEQVIENLKKVEKQEEGITIKSILIDLKVSELEDNKRSLYKNKILESDSGFVRRLTTTYPLLTKTDIEICCYERTGLSRKEVANLRGTTIEAVKSNRYRLKKKLGISSNVSLKAFVLNI